MSPARSGSGAKPGIGVTVVAAGIIVAGCATTQEAARRVQLDSARIRASQRPTLVTVAGRRLRLSRVALVRGRTGAAIIVRLRNPGSQPISDLPISVGLRVHGRRARPLNVRSTAEFSYFDSHVPLIGAGDSITWVYSTARRVPAGARPWAIVGRRPTVHTSPRGALPVISVNATPAGATRVRARVGLRNQSSVPQYQLQVYAVARRRGRYVAAGALTVAHLGSDGSRTVHVPVLGNAGGARLRFEAVPTMAS